MTQIRILEQSTKQKSSLFCQAAPKRVSKSSSHSTIPANSPTSPTSNPPADRQKRLLISCTFVPNPTSMNAPGPSHTHNRTHSRGTFRSSAIAQQSDCAGVRASTFTREKEASGVKGCCGWRSIPTFMKIGKSVSSSILLRKLAPNYCRRAERAAMTSGGTNGSGSSPVPACCSSPSTSILSSAAMACSSFPCSLAACSSGCSSSGGCSSRIEKILPMLSISLTSGMMLMEGFILGAGRERSWALSSAWNSSRGISCTSAGSEESISITITLRRFLRSARSAGGSASFFISRSSAANFDRRSGVFSRSDSPPVAAATATLIFFSEGALFFGRGSSASAVLARLRAVRLGVGSSAFSRCLPLRSFCDSALRSSTPSVSVSLSRFDSLLASPKAAAMKLSRAASGRGSKCCARGRRQAGQARRCVRRQRSMQSLQKRCEQRRKTGPKRIYRQSPQLRAPARAEQSQREGREGRQSRVGNRERTERASSSRWYSYYSSIGYISAEGRGPIQSFKCLNPFVSLQKQLEDQLKFLDSFTQFGQ